VDKAVSPWGTTISTRLGFGASRVLGGAARNHSLMLLETAYDQGIRHFDTAPSYGSGGAEYVVGEFLARHPGECTVTTKFGIPRPQGKNRAIQTHGRALARLVLWRLPAIKKRLVQATQSKGIATEYDPTQMWTSLQISLRELRCDRIDLFLLHEIEFDNLTEELRDVLEQAVNIGLIGAWGIGSDRRKIDRIVEGAPSWARVLQFEWSVMSRNLPSYSGAFVITYRAISTAFGELRSLLADEERSRRWSNEVGMDLSNEKTLSLLLLGAALRANRGGIVLFSSNRPDRIRANASALSTVSDPAVARFVELVREQINHDSP
jgi:D-threo-aldose 1-dehydrogenase